MSEQVHPEDDIWLEWHEIPMRLTWHCPPCDLTWVIPSAHELDSGGICPVCEQWILTPPQTSAVLRIVP